MILHRVLRNLLGASEDPLPEHELAVPSPEGGGVGGAVGDCGVLGHGHGASLVPLPLGQDVTDVLVTFDEVLELRVHLWSEILHFRCCKKPQNISYKLWLYIE